MLGIEGHTVTTQNFAALGDNENPITGDKLCPRSSKVKFHDVVVSAAKSYSVAALVGKDEQLVGGFQRAVEKTFGKLERYIAVRDRAANQFYPYIKLLRSPPPFKPANEKAKNFHFLPEINHESEADPLAMK